MGQITTTVKARPAVKGNTQKERNEKAQEITDDKRRKEKLGQRHQRKGWEVRKNSEKYLPR